jgi:hypothetical protein
LPSSSLATTVSEFEIVVSGDTTGVKTGLTDGVTVGVTFGVVTVGVPLLITILSSAPPPFPVTKSVDFMVSIGAGVNTPSSPNGPDACLNKTELAFLSAKASSAVIPKVSATY